MLRLFKIIVDDEIEYYDSLRRTKFERYKAADEGKPVSVVMRGPDHKKGESFNDNSK